MVEREWGHVRAGEYTIRVALRHDSVQVLEQLMDVPLRVDKALEKEVSVPVHRRQADAVAGEKPATKDVVLCAGERCAGGTLAAALLCGVCHIAHCVRSHARARSRAAGVCRASFTLGPVPEDKWPKDAAPGATFNGPVRLAKCSSSSTHGDKGAPTKCSLFYTVPAAKARKDGNDEGGDGDEGDAGKSAAVKLQESRRNSDVRPRSHPPVACAWPAAARLSRGPRCTCRENGRNRVVLTRSG